MMPDAATSTPRTRDVRDDSGWVMIPVVVLLVVALGFAFALLAVVDRQTRASVEQRDMDAAQVLAEGVATSTANVLADSAADTDWNPVGCRTIAGRLTGVSTNVQGSFAARVETEARAYFRKTKSDDTAKLTTYGTGNRSATWSGTLCPTTDSGLVGTDLRFTDAVLQRTHGTGSVNGRRTVWVQVQANLLDETGVRFRARSVAAKVQQDGRRYTPPTDAVNTGAFSTDLAVAGGSVLTDGLVGGVLKKTLATGATPLIAASDAKLGIRCGLLGALSPNSIAEVDLCVSGTLAGVAGVTNTLGVGALNTMLGIDRFTTLDGWSTAPSNAIQAYRNATPSQPGGARAVGGAGEVRDGAGFTRSAPPTAPACLTKAQWDAVTVDTVVFIEKVGNGEQYCTLDPQAVGVVGVPTPKIVVIARGGVIVTGKIGGVVYALNQQECDNHQADGICTNVDRKSSPKRELIRIQNPGKITGSAWVDGAKGQVGIYPGPLATPSSATLADHVATPANCDAGGLLHGTLSTVGSLVGAVNGLVGSLLGGYEYRAFAGDGATACSTLGQNLAALSPTTVLGLLDGGPLTVQVAQRRKCGKTLLNLGLVCTEWGPWENYTGDPAGSPPAGTADIVMPNLLTSGPLLGTVSSLLTATIGGYTAIQHDLATIDRAGILLSTQASFAPGTFRNLPVSAAPAPGS